MRQFALVVDSLPYCPDNRPSTSSTTKNQTHYDFPKQTKSTTLSFDRIDHHPAHCYIHTNANLSQKRQLGLDKKRCLISLGHRLTMIVSPIAAAISVIANIIVHRQAILLLVVESGTRKLRKVVESRTKYPFVFEHVMDSMTVPVLDSTPILLL